MLDEKTNIKRKNDKIVLVMSAVIVLFAALIFVLLRQGSGKKVVIYVDGKEEGTYSLFEDREIKIKGALGENTLVIENGYIYMKEAVCPDKVCVHKGRTNIVNDPIVCLPGKIIVVIEGKEKDE